MKPLVCSLVLTTLLGAGAARGADDELGASVEVRGPATQQILVLDSPAVTGDHYALGGNVSYEGVAGDGYLEMWSVFADGSRYFSRTLGESGPMAKLRGSAPARAFTLPFFLTPDAPRPVRLELNVVLPGAGRVQVSGLQLHSGAVATGTPGAWWSPETGGWIGGAAGSAVGVLGAVIGTLCSLGRGRRIVIAGLLALGITGLLVLATGAVALALGQPYEVWYPLLLLGALDPVLAFALLPTARRRYEGIELRQMRARDVR